MALLVSEMIFTSLLLIVWMYLRIVSLRLNKISCIENLLI